jgi:hypothetical protein
MAIIGKIEEDRNENDTSVRRQQFNCGVGFPIRR